MSHAPGILNLDPCPGHSVDTSFAPPCVAPTASTLKTDQTHHTLFVLPALDDDLREILGRPNFACCEIATLLRSMGHEIAEKAEAEQAAVIYWMLTKYAVHGSDWWPHCRDELQGSLGRR